MSFLLPDVYKISINDGRGVGAHGLLKCWGSLINQYYSQTYSTVVKAIILSDVFRVLYKIIAKHFIETGLISEEKRFGGYINKELTLYEQEFSMYERSWK